MTDKPDTPSTDELMALGNQLQSAIESNLQETPVDLDITQDADTPDEEEQPLSKTALELDDWSMARGRSWLHSEHCPPSLKDVAEPSTPATFAADMLAMAFEMSPQFAKNPENSRLSHFLKTLSNTPAYRAIHEQTQLKPIPSEMAASSFATEFIALAKQTCPKDQLEQDAQALSAANKALDAAGKDVENYSNSCQSLGGDGSDRSMGMSPEKVRELFTRIRENSQLRRIMELAGRYQRLARSIQNTKPTHGQDEVVGIELGNDISRMLPVELSKLSDPSLEDSFYQRFADGRLFQYELRATANDARGPVVVVVDESGSMTGDPVANAKAFALAMAWIARHQKRWICLVGFAGGTEGNYFVQQPGESNVEGLINWLAHFYSGGTSCDVPLVELPTKWGELGCPKGRTDIIMVTDGIVNVPDGIRDDFNKWRADTEAKTNLIVIGQSTPGDMNKIADNVYLPQHFGLEAEGVAESLAV